MPSHHPTNLFQQQDKVLVRPYAPCTDLPPPGACNTPPGKATTSKTAGSSSSNNHPPGPSCKHLVELFACIVDTAE
ncbi:hypothetical protein PISMIDRAFT_15729 [Pisolithus microcarpus 441]|uniref:Uncharacterized protein n=1 Tax=Pisolithus microcarpus 441 TaxID=765257 RepID=A0A0C9Z9M3_9AGAM|nr:hypothetical protein BKA83DRAFT_15729 [Pisolithus microcarpus]KIK16608.1 hypothetical protein PISMIDRAFT_15729 [Pisolithus microcarpus 441]